MKFQERIQQGLENLTNAIKVYTAVIAAAVMIARVVIMVMNVIKEMRSSEIDVEPRARDRHQFYKEYQNARDRTYDPMDFPSDFNINLYTGKPWRKAKRA